MSTGYRLELGYNSHGNRDDLWPELKAYAIKLCDTPDLIAAEVRRVEPTVDASDAMEYAEAYRVREDLTVQFRENDRTIVQMASGGGHGRDLKEACRRAFCRLVIEAMHMKRIEVNLIVS